MISLNGKEKLLYGALPHVYTRLCGSQFVLYNITWCITLFIRLSGRGNALVGKYVVLCLSYRSEWWNHAVIW